MPPLEDPHADVINDLDPMDDNAPTVASQISPVTAAGAPSDHSQADADTQSAVTARGAHSLAPNNDDASYTKSQASPTFKHNTMDDLSVSTTRSSKHSGDALDLSTPPLQPSPHTKYHSSTIIEHPITVTDPHEYAAPMTDDASV